MANIFSQQLDGQSRPLSDTGVRTALRSLIYDSETMTARDFRAMARTLFDHDTRQI
ncbi:hypothetical protein ACJJID_13940 [Microbulbifer sp. CnH-101-G]|uniref:hypothetical protein n=1 Tax=Microbulbifer sp. CnH-101-G TaxID=3243393 RepID=UPI0040392CAA